MRRFAGLICLLLVFGAGNALAEVPTYNKDIAPILWKNCAGCHRPGEIGPFSLLTYKDAAKRSSFLAEITESRRMPPWKPEPGFGSFHDERRLSDAEIKKIAAWAEGGAPEGNAGDLPPAPKFPEGWQLGTPDLVLKATEAFDVPAKGADIYRCFVIPIPIDTNKTVAAFEFRPGNRRVVHHALLYLDSTGAARARRIGARPGLHQLRRPGVPADRRTRRLGPGGHAPDAARRHGQVPAQGKRPGAPDSLSPRRQARKRPVSRRHLLHQEARSRRSWRGSPSGPASSISRPARAAITHPRESAPLPVDVQAIGIAPHMHYIGKEMKVVAKMPDGKTTPLIWIKDWDFNWQGQYQYQHADQASQGDGHQARRLLRQLGR